MKVTTNNKRVAMEVILAQNLFDLDIPEMTIRSIGNQQHCVNDYDVEVTGWKH